MERLAPIVFSVIQPGATVPLQRFWIPVHAAITVFIAVSLAVTWRERRVRRLLLTGVAPYVVMRVWSGLFFIREMLEFQKVPVDSPPTPELSARVASWIFWSWFREPLDVVSFLCFLLARYWLKRPETTGA
jgi:hypothetical protein